MRQTGSPGDVETRASQAQAVARMVRAGLRLQTFVALALALAALPAGLVPAYSSLCGSLAAWLPGAVFAVAVARKIGGDSGAFLGTAALAELGKLLLTGLLCAAVFIVVKPLAAGWFFAGMIAVLAAGWVGLARAAR